MSDTVSPMKPHITGGRMIRYVLRVLWIAVRLAAVIVLIDRGSTFFYQGF